MTKTVLVSGMRLRDAALVRQRLQAEGYTATLHTRRGRAGTTVVGVKVIRSVNEAFESGATPGRTPENRLSRPPKGSPPRGGAARRKPGSARPRVRVLPAEPVGNPSVPRADAVPAGASEDGLAGQPWVPMPGVHPVGAV